MALMGLIRLTIALIAALWLLSGAWNTLFTSMDWSGATKLLRIPLPAPGSESPTPEPLIVLVTVATNESPFIYRSLANRERYAVRHRSRLVFRPVLSSTHLVDVDDAGLFQAPACGGDESITRPKAPFGLNPTRWSTRMKSRDTRYAGYWIKVAALIETMDLYPNAAYLWWLDLDALITNMNIRVHDLVPGLTRCSNHTDVPYEFILSNDYHGLNTGSFLVRNSPFMKEMLFKLYDTFISGSPKDNDQIYIRELVQSTPALAERTLILPNKALNAWPAEIELNGLQAWDEGDFVWHIPGAWAMDMLAILGPKANRSKEEETKLAEKVEAYRKKFSYPGMKENEWKYRYLFDKYEPMVWEA